MSSGISLALPACMEHAECQSAGLAPAAREDIAAYYREIAPFYEAELAQRDDLRFWECIARALAGGRFLEIGAGSGRVTEVLARWADAVVGVDVSPDLLRLAQVRLSTHPNVHLLLADMLALPLLGPFDAIVAANDPLSHLTAGADRDRALSAASALLAPGGCFLLDALWLAPAEAAAVATPGGRVRERTTTLDGQPLRVVERWRRPPASAHGCTARYEYRRLGHPPVVAEFAARDWSAVELFGRLGRAGLVVSELWGSYQGGPWDADHSSQLIVAATRRGATSVRGRQRDRQPATDGGPRGVPGRVA